MKTHSVKTQNPSAKSANQNYLPIFIRSQKILLLGGGEVAWHKYQILRASQCPIKVISLTLHPNLLLDLQKDGVDYEIRSFESKDINSFDIIVSAMNDSKANAELFQAAQKQRKLINCVDETQYCNFIFPAIINQEGTLIAISTGGKSPIFASWLKSKILQALPTQFSKLAQLIYRQRSFVGSQIHTKKAQVAFWHELLNHHQGELEVHNENEFIQKALNQFNQKANQSSEGRQLGQVYLIGAGPGSADHLTLKAARILAMADVVLYDGLVNGEVLAMIRKEALKINVSKRFNQKCVSQHQINDLLLEYAKKVQTVVRLKSGDPLIFSRGSEELKVLKEAGIQTQIIPGISAFQAAAAKYQFALTHRDYAKGLQLHTLHNLEDKSPQFYDNLSQSNDTFAFYMATEKLDYLTALLIQKGVSPKLGIALIENISLSQERIHVGNLGNIQKKIKGEIAKPCLIVMGQTINKNLKASRNQYQLADLMSPSNEALTLNPVIAEQELAVK